MNIRRYGFTIIELMITISIIMLLVAATIVGFTRARMTGRDTQRISDTLALAQAIDQTALAQRGAYPLPVGGNSPRVLASQINTQNLNLSLFKNNTLPRDPLPAQSACGGEPNYLCGYTYNDRAGGTLSSSLARVLTSGQYEYVLEIGLEGDRFNDEQSLTAGPAGTNSGRTQFIYFGKYCGATPASNTCSIP